MSPAQLLVQVAARGTALLLLTILAGLLFRRASAATRHLIWTGGLAVSLVASLISVPQPAFPLLPALPAVAPAVDLPPSTGAVTPSSTGPTSGEVWSGTMTERAPIRPDPRPAEPQSPATDWPRVLGLIWVIGLMAAGLRLVAGRIAVGRLARRAVPVAAPEWQETIRVVLSTSAFRRPIRFLQSPEVVTPCTWGSFEPTVLLPADGAAWTGEERRQVIVHELAHVRRFDTATQVIASLAVALHWFNPLAWLAQRECRIAREQACDDAVLAAGGMASTYAGLLLAAAAPEGGPWLPAEAQAMARRSQIGDRLLAVLDPARRRNPVDRRAIGWITTTALAAAIPVVSLGARPAEPLRMSGGNPAQQVTDQDGERGTRPSALGSVKRDPARGSPLGEKGERPAPSLSSIGVPNSVLGTRPSALGSAERDPARGSPSGRYSERLTMPQAQAADLCDPTKPGTGKKSRSSHTSSYSDDGGDEGSNWYTVTWTGPDCSVSIKSRGKVTFTSAEDDVAGISDGGRFQVEHEDGSTTRSYLVTSKNGTLERRYRFNDENATMDNDALKWRAALILEFIRRSGYDAEARARRIRKSKGVDGLVQEIGAIRSDGVRATYLKVSLDDPSTTASDAARLLTLTQGIGSDGDRATVLAATPVALLSEEAVQRAYADGAKGISSDGDLATVLTKAIRSGKLTARSCEWVLGLVGNISSDGDRSSVLISATETLQWNSSCVRRSLELTQEIGSDGDKATTLIRFLRRHQLPDDLIPVFFQTTATIGSDGDHSTVLHRVIDLDSPSDAVVVGLLEDSRHIGSDGDHSSVLVAAARRGLVKSERLKSLYRDSARGIGSDGDREAAMRALERS